MNEKDYWDLKKRPHTKLKLDIFKKYLYSWCSIFANQPWCPDVFIVDCFAGKGLYKDNTDGSPLITVKAAKEFQNYFFKKTNKNKKYFKIKCFFIDNNKTYCENLTKLLSIYSPEVNFKIINSDFNEVIGEIITEIGNRPALFFIDPYGIKGVKKESILSIINKVGAKDIMFNYINEGIVRIGGLAKKNLKKNAEDINIKEFKTVEHIKDFIGDDFEKIIDKNDKEILNYYVENVLKSNNNKVDSKDKLEVIGFNMPYPHKSDTIYFLLFASRNNNAIKIVKQVYAKSKERNFNGQKSIFNAKEQSKLYNDFKV